MDTIGLDLLNDIFRSLEWSDLLAIAALVVLEAALSADNAVALAAMVRHLPNDEERDRALRWGIIGAYSFRIAIILAATWVIGYWPARLVGAAYLLWLSVQHFRDVADDETERIPNTANFWQTIVLVELTDIAFSLDSIAASIAVSSKTWIIIAGGLLGITLMRFMASFFVHWLDEFERLEDSAYWMIAFVGVRMLGEIVLPQFVIPEWMMMGAMAIMFVWGFSKRNAGAGASLEELVERELGLECEAALEARASIESVAD